MRPSSGGTWARLDGGGWEPTTRQITSEQIKADAEFYAAQFRTQLEGLKQPPDAAPPHVPVAGSHLWSAALPANLTPGYHRLEVRTMDMCQHTYAATRIFRID